MVSHVWSNNHTLNLVLACSASSLHSLHKPKSRLLDRIKSVILLLAELLVLLLQLLYFRLEKSLSISLLLLLCLDSSGEVVSRHGLDLFDFSLLCSVTQVNVGWGAHWLEVLVGELLEGLEVAAALVVLEVAWVAVLDGGESTDPVGIAERLAGRGAVYIGDQGSFARGVFGHKFVPCWLH